MKSGQGGGVGKWLRGFFESPPAPSVPLPELSLPSGDGPLVWMRIGAGYEQTGADDVSLAPTLIQLLAQLRRLGLQIVVSRAEGEPPDLAKRGVSAIPDPGLDKAHIAAHLEVLNPSVLLLIGADLPRALIETAARRDIPVILAEARLSARKPSLRQSLVRGSPVFQMLDLLLLPDAVSRRAALELGADPASVELTGPITQIRDPLHHNEAERVSLAEAFQGRQVWLAVNVTEAELDAVIETQLTVLRYSLRALLILVPVDPGLAVAMANRMSAAGLVVAQRSTDEDPTDEVNVYICDDIYELGLWYRLAPLCFMGSTLYGPTDGARDPFEAASLGSAAVHGPLHGAFPEEWAQLDGAGAARSVEDAAGLTQAVVTLLAPEQAARLATNAWSVATGGAGVASRIAHAVRETITGDRS
ncbi:3-deoxy-D-manno-octulosonic acid transferase [Paracoccus aerodenitrificans]|uniref:3-deoxy-D-manno-octulosonic acid transferase n=1 Tax=Paracoccus aerodenitrificans TaxID=3017781 RepID=UPI0022F0B76E|nr:glycosyltransferase N-terminal domain-containing protein [Paracoccus aerodenitrificans]WBU63684.1 3-deoxy-D-manno-octulosonic acid transferase [Paracoccus aerodenitrificans]